jgi:hypothetical protein
VASPVRTTIDGSATSHDGGVSRRQGAPKSGKAADDPVFVTVAEHADEEHGAMLACLRRRSRQRQKG